MYGNTQWSPDLTGEKRMRAILNGFTRMRFVNALTGELDFDLKEGAGTAPKGWVPWFEYKHRLLCHMLRALVNAGPHQPPQSGCHRHRLSLGWRAYRRSLPGSPHLSGKMPLLGQPTRFFKKT